MGFFPLTDLMRGKIDRSDWLHQTSKLNNEFATLQPDAALPDWLTTNPDNLMAELRQTYAAIPSLYNAKPIKTAYNNQINTVQGMGGQIANNAMRESIARSGITGGEANSSMIKAQTMLPVYDQTSKLESEKAAAVATQHHMQSQMMAQVAAQMAQLRSSYLANIGQLQLAKQGQTNTFVGQEQNRVDQAQQMSMMAALASQAAATNGGGGSAPAPFSGMMTRAPNNSGMGGSEFTPEFKKYLGLLGDKGKQILLQGPMQYPSAMGVAAGDSLDKYQGWLRSLTNVADPRVPDYNVKLLGPGSRPPNFTEDLNPLSPFAGGRKY
jgi:hypothetical protein